MIVFMKHINVFRLDEFVFFVVFLHYHITKMLLHRCDCQMSNVYPPLFYHYSHTFFSIRSDLSVMTYPFFKSGVALPVMKI